MSNNECKLNYSLISKYRAVLMGLAIILVMFCHLDVAQDHNNIAATPLARALHVFTVSVDIFLFLSGVGLYYSYSKKKKSYISFEKRRLARILPYYLIIGGSTYIIYDLVMNHFDVWKVLSDILFITWFRDGQTWYWYILAIIVFYLMFPVFYMLVNSKHGLLKTLLFSLFWWTLVEVICYLFPNAVSFKVALARLPIFVIGIYFGMLSYRKVESKRLTVIFLTILGFGLFLGTKVPPFKPISEFFYYPVRALLAISIISTVIILMEIIETKRVGRFFSQILGWFGGLTIELYLLHQSYMILLNYPYRLFLYFIVAFALPSLTAALIYICRKMLKRGQ